MQAAAGASVRDALAAAEAALRGARVDSPRLDAELLLAEALGVDRARLYSDGSDPLSGEARERLARLVERRAAREPVAYILGRKGFRRIELHVDPRVLIRRPDTELLVEPAFGLPDGARVHDVGTGSG